MGEANLPFWDSSLISSLSLTKGGMLEMILFVVIKAAHALTHPEQQQPGLLYPHYPKR